MNDNPNSLIEALFANSDEGGDLTKIAGAEAAAMLDEIEKTAAAEGIDLSQFTDDEIVEMLGEAMAEGQGEFAAGAPGEPEGVEKAASVPDADGEFPEGVNMEKVAAAQYLGAVQAHAMADEFADIFGIEKVAGVEDLDEETFEKLAQMNANDVLYQVGVLHDPDYADSFAGARESVEGREKVASLSLSDDLGELIGQRTAQILDDNGWDIEALAEAMDQVED